MGFEKLEDEDEFREYLKEKLIPREYVRIPSEYLEPVTPETIKTSWFFEPRPRLVKTEDKKEEGQNMITDGYYINHESRLVFSTAYQMSQNRPERAVKVMVVGPSGYGKTLMPRLLAEKTGMRFMRMNCASVRDPEEWFGYREARDGSTVFVRSRLIETLEEGNAVILLDEFNRLEPWLTNTLFPLLDDDGKTHVHDQEFKIGPNVIVAATINVGYKFTGTFEMDEALGNRFELFLEVNPMPKNEEEKVLMVQCGLTFNDSAKVVKMANMLREREVVCSTRSTLAIANLMRAGMTVREAFEAVVITRIPEEVGGNNLRKSMFDMVNVELGILGKRKIEHDVFDDGLALDAVATSQVLESGGLKDYKCTFSIEKATRESEFFPAINVIKVLRRIEFVNSGLLTLKEAKDILELLKGGEVFTAFVHDGSNIQRHVDDLAQLGVTLEFTQ